MIWIFALLLSCCLLGIFKTIGLVLLAFLVVLTIILWNNHKELQEFKKDEEI